MPYARFAHMAFTCILVGCSVTIGRDKRKELPTHKPHVYKITIVIIIIITVIIHKYNHIHTPYTIHSIYTDCTFTHSYTGRLPVRVCFKCTKYFCRGWCNYSVVSAVCGWLIRGAHGEIKRIRSAASTEYLCCKYDIVKKKKNVQKKKINRRRSLRR